MDNFEAFKHVSPINLNFDIAFDDNTMGTNPTIATPKNKEVKFHEKSIFNTIRLFIGSMYGDGTYNFGKIFIIRGGRKIHVKCDCTDVSTINIVKKPVSYIFGWCETCGFKMFEKPNMKHETFLKNEQISCKLNKISLGR